MLGFLRSGSKRTKLIWWVVTISTVATFLLGFSFFGAMGRDPNLAARQSGAYGSINGDKVTREMWANAFESERAAYVQRFQSSPVDRDLRAVEQSAWRKLVDMRLLNQAASKAGLSITDNDVIFRLQTDPPPAVLSAPAFQTGGQFDPQKYRSAMSNPANDWSALEEQVRDEGAGVKLQKVLLSSIKLSEGELNEALRQRFTQITTVVLQVPPADSGHAPGGPEALQKAYDRYKDLMAAPARTQLEMLAVPIDYTADEIKAATDQATNLYNRAQSGEDFVQLVRDYSEGPNSDRGGIIDRVVTTAELGTLGPQVAAAKAGQVLPPVRQGASMMVFRVLGPQQDSTARNLPAGSYKLAELMIKFHANADGLRAQYEKVLDIVKRAKAVGLSRAATEKGLATSKTPFYDLDNVPQQLYLAPEAADWGVSHAKGDVSPVYESPEAFIVCQVAVQHQAGIPPREEVSDQLQQVADLDYRVEQAKPRADQVEKALKGGASLEDAARSAGLATQSLTFSRSQPDPRVAASAEFIGMLFGAKPGQVVGPVRSPSGWYFGRVTGVVAPVDSVLANPQLRGQVTTDLLSRRQRSFFSGYLGTLRSRSKIEDNRSAFGASTQ